MSGQEALTIFLRSATNRPCSVLLTNGVELHGILCTIDAFFNLVLKDAKEILPKVYSFHKPNSFPSIFVRGSNVIHITPLDEAAEPAQK